VNFSRPDFKGNIFDRTRGSEALLDPYHSQAWRTHSIEMATAALSLATMLAMNVSVVRPGNSLAVSMQSKRWFALTLTLSPRRGNRI